MEYYIRDLTLDDEKAFNEAQEAKLFINNYKESEGNNGSIMHSIKNLYFFNCTHNQIVKDDNEFEQIKLYLRKLTCIAERYKVDNEALVSKEQIYKNEGISNELYKQHLETKGFTAQEFYNLSKTLFSINNAISAIKNGKIEKDSVIVFNNDLFLSIDTENKKYQLKDFFDEIKAKNTLLLNLSRQQNCIIIEHFLDFISYSDFLKDLDELDDKPTTLTKSYKMLFENDFILLNNADSINQIISTHNWTKDIISQNQYKNITISPTHKTYFYSRANNMSPFYRNSITFPSQEELAKNLYIVFPIISNLMSETEYGSY